MNLCSCTSDGSPVNGNLVRPITLDAVENAKKLDVGAWFFGRASEAGTLIRTLGGVPNFGASVTRRQILESTLSCLNLKTSLTITNLHTQLQLINIICSRCRKRANSHTYLPNLL